MYFTPEKCYYFIGTVEPHIALTENKKWKSTKELYTGQA